MTMYSNSRCAGMALALAVTLLLSACGGSSYDSADAGTPATPATPLPTSEVPSRASQSIMGFISYLKLLVVSAADQLEPVDTSMVVAPADDSGEPVAVN
jgi:hypothetical protein